MKKYLLLIFALSLAAAASAAEGPDSIIRQSGVRGGLAVHVGCGDGARTLRLRAGDAWLVHGLDTDPAHVAAARGEVQRRGLYGKVSVERYDGRRLPYADALVNLLVVEQQSELPLGELWRVLAPRGAGCIRAASGDAKSGAESGIQRRLRALGAVDVSQRDGWIWFRKAWPADIDQWTHFLYDASGNAVSHDRRVGSPRRVQWMAGPKRTRDHDALASMSAMTSSNGRLFYIFDEGPTSLTHRPPNWKLIARDAFNGILLWKRDIPTWVTHLFYFRTGPAQLPRRLVSVADRVYVTLGFDAPVSMLDAATGQTLRTYEGSENTEEIIWHDGVLLAVIGDPNIMNDEAPKVYGYWELSVDRKPTVNKQIVAYQADTGEVLWRKTGEDLAYLAPLSLAARGDEVFYLDHEHLHAVDLSTGASRWQAPFATEGLYLRNYAPTVVAYNDVVLCMTWNRLCAFSAADGRLLWQQKGAIGFASPGDLFAIDGLAWAIPMTSAIWKDNRLGPDGKVQTGIDIPRENFLGNGGAEIWGMDVQTGEVERTLPRMKLLPGGHHHRCYRNKATERYLICGRRGLEYIDLIGEQHVNNWHLRGVCQYGVMPANGYIYVPPDPCQCFNFIKLNGFYALSSGNSLDGQADSGGPLLEKGPAYTTVRDGPAAKPKAAEPDTAADGELAWHPPVWSADPDQWPTYRGNITRSGSTKRHLPADLRLAWQAELGGRLSAPVAADGRLVLSSKDAETIQCLDARTGKPLWRFIAGGPVDSPPTLSNGLCVFGCADGSVYCVSADDGRLAWRQRLAPIDRRVIANNRLESVWPIHGSVLVQDAVVYCAAGRSSYLDGGIRLYALDLFSGAVLHEADVRAQPVYPGQPSPESKMTGALPDVLVSDGQHINMRQVQFDRNLVQSDTAQLKTLFATTGLLEDIWAHRQNWCLGYPRPINSHAHAAGARARGLRDPFPSGKLIVFDQSYAYGVLNPYTWLKQTEQLHPPTHEGHLHQKYSRYKAEYFPVGVKIYAKPNRAVSRRAQAKRRRGEAPAVAAGDGWVVDAPFQPRAMVLAGDVLFLAGWKDAVAIAEKTGRPLDPAHPDPRPSFLRALGTRDGKLLAEYPLPAEPVFDGMCVAHGRLYLAIKDGSIRCFEPR